jgi:hypothetical protein
LTFNPIPHFLHLTSQALFTSFPASTEFSFNFLGRVCQLARIFNPVHPSTLFPPLLLKFCIVAVTFNFDVC